MSLAGVEDFGWFGGGHFSFWLVWCRGRLVSIFDRVRGFWFFLSRGFEGLHFFFPFGPAGEEDQSSAPGFRAQEVEKEKGMVSRRVRDAPADRRPAGMRAVAVGRDEPVGWGRVARETRGVASFPRVSLSSGPVRRSIASDFHKLITFKEL